MPRPSAHYDYKYFHEVLEPEAQHAGIRVLMQTYLATFRDLGIQTWLMHGSLLGWWWGKKVRASDVFTLNSSHKNTQGHAMGLGR
jgi:hypothetical protein